jgi:quinol monooxygenase YgiN
MVSFSVRMRFRQEDRKQVIEILRSLTAASRQEPGCITYVPLLPDDDADAILIWEQYRDEAALEAHRASPHFKQYAVGGLYQLMRERTVENFAGIE